MQRETRLQVFQLCLFYAVVLFENTEVPFSQDLTFVSGTGPLSSEPNPETVNVNKEIRGKLDYFRCASLFSCHV